MQKSTTINTSDYEELRLHSYFFLHYQYETYYDYYNEKEIDNSYWHSVDPRLRISFSDDGSIDYKNKYCLCIVDRADYVVEKSGVINYEKTIIEYHNASSDNERDCFIIINECIVRYANTGDNYSFVPLLWMLDNLYIHVGIIEKIVNNYIHSLKSVFLSALSRISKCLSVKKQKAISYLFYRLGARYEVCLPDYLNEAFAFFGLEGDVRDYNIFELVNAITNSNILIIGSAMKGDNPFVVFKKWLNTSNPLSDYGILIPIYSIVNERVRLDIVKRYFHDIRLGNTTFDDKILKQFICCQKDDNVVFRYSIMTPTEKVVLTVPLLCDSILNIYNTKGESFQQFDGMLDLLVKNCDSYRPSVDLQLERIFPTCKYGVVCNDSFKGFIDYNLVRRFDEKMMTDDNLFQFCKSILNRSGKRKQYIDYTCCVDTSNNPSATSQCCPRNVKSDIETNEFKELKCFIYKEREDKWIIDTNVQSINTFISDPIIENNAVRKYEVGVDMISIPKLREYIQSLITKYGSLGKGEFLTPSSGIDHYDNEIIERFSSVLRMRIFPRKGAVIGNSSDLFGYWKEVCSSMSLSCAQIEDEKCPEYIAAYKLFVEKEFKEVASRTIKSLIKELGEQYFNGEYFELPYHFEYLDVILKKYYFNKSFCGRDNLECLEFLKRVSVSDKYNPLCAPVISEANNPATDISYFWCRGKECFRNSLGKQTLSDCNRWENYSLYHLIEIIGFPKLHITKGGYEPDDVIRRYIATISRAIKKFNRLKCRNCGHLLFSHREGNFNSHHYYSCKNPNCPEYKIPVYLNYCYKCKKGLIDSRDNKKCPNGWHICPTCLSCCDDELFERLAQRYYLVNSPVPPGIQKFRGRGHNNKGVFFCTHCGIQVLPVEDEYGNIVYVCPNCHNKFEDVGQGKRT